jgi:hypothetical protein
MVTALDTMPSMWVMSVHASGRHCARETELSQMTALSAEEDLPLRHMDQRSLEESFKPQNLGRTTAMTKKVRFRPYFVGRRVLPSDPVKLARMPRETWSGLKVVRR